MSLWIAHPTNHVPADSYQDVVSTGTAPLTAFDLSSIPEDDSRDAEVIHKLALAEVRGGVIYIGTPPRLLTVSDEHKVVGDLFLGRFIGDGAPQIG